MFDDLTLDTNPYTPPDEPYPGDPSRAFDRRFFFLLLPPLIPLAIHAIVRLFIPANEGPYHALFTLGAVIPAWIWAQSMVDRLRLPIWKAYLLSCGVWGAVIACSLFSSTIVNWFIGRR